MVRPRKDRPPKQPRDPGEVIHPKPYWFDRSRSLAELYGWSQTIRRDSTGLVERHDTAVNRPVGQLDELQLVTLLTQGTDPHYLVPVALDRLRGGLDPMLLNCLVHADPAFWRTHPHLFSEFLALLAATPDDALTAEARRFRERDR